MYTSQVSCGHYFTSNLQYKTKKKEIKSSKILTACHNSRPNMGIVLFSALDTYEGMCFVAMINMSKKEEWGATNMIGASALSAGVPL